MWIIANKSYDNSSSLDCYSVLSRTTNFVFVILKINSNNSKLNLHNLSLWQITISSTFPCMDSSSSLLKFFLFQLIPLPISDNIMWLGNYSYINYFYLYKSGSYLAEDILQ